MSWQQNRATFLIVSTFIASCLYVRTRPWKYFQLNASVFNEQTGVFSKMEIDQLIPDRWRLLQTYDDGSTIPATFPVFVKPEWGQNADGIFRVETAEELSKVRGITSNANVRYLIQVAATETCEFEIFWILDDKNIDLYANLTITQVLNDAQSYPVNGVNNPNTEYRDITDQFNSLQKKQLWNMLGEIGRFGITRIGLRANSIDALLTGQFHIIEINLFIPMPINVMDKKYSLVESGKLIRRYMMSLAKITKARNRTNEQKPVYIKTMLYNRHNIILKYLRKHV